MTHSNWEVEMSISLNQAAPALFPTVTTELMAQPDHFPGSPLFPPLYSGSSFCLEPTLSFFFFFFLSTDIWV